MLKVNGVTKSIDTFERSVCAGNTIVVLQRPEVGEVITVQKTRVDLAPISNTLQGCRCPPPSPSRPRERFEGYEAANDDRLDELTAV
ncbi:hypothetical protein BST65_06565 [Bradyrhizobium canariense]|nr:hypothetical protein BST65_06565 [Bradyrhizobium canariense]OSI37320.1 hypothetical protein BST66_03750 [Bradyrhizobium canariense]OSI52039.1 hypothetical protein BSZ20_04220 [Bradyrhizobium canariense]OSI56343.1 hypothetical protein BST67_03715 [Bradyrhizobium canariense]OSI59414.1 hypothetical protein BSZ15_04940 [Bradyrhizobium canariense]